MRDQTIACIERERIIAILRGVTGERCIQTAEALYQGGIRLMEITFSQKAKSAPARCAARISVGVAAPGMETMPSSLVRRITSGLKSGEMIYLAHIIYNLSRKSLGFVLSKR